jgi:uncharacterized repeat protein (TIGR02059 family)
MKKIYIHISFVLLIVLIFSIVPVVSATTYYVSTSGNDNANGTTSSTPWKTLAKVNSRSYNPGDSILFKRGDTWTASGDGVISISNSGTATKPIVFGAYGTGEKPIITGRYSLSGWNVSGNWTNVSGNIWRMKVDATAYCHRAWVNGKEVYHNSTSSVTAALPMYWDSGNNYLYLYSTSNPATAFTNIEGLHIDILVYATPGSADYITLQNLDFRGVYWLNVYLRGVTNWTIENCDIGLYCSHTGVYCTGVGTTRGSTDNIVIRNCTFDTDDHNVDAWTIENTFEAVCVWDGANNLDIYNNVFRDWTHAAVSIQVNSESTPVTNLKFHNNICTCEDIDYGRAFNFEFYPVLGNSFGNEVYDNFFYHHSVFNLISGDGVKVYNNIFDGVYKTSYKDVETAEAINLQPYVGISTNNEIYNNIIANCDGAGIGIWFYNRDCKNNAIKNNIFYNNGISNGGYQIFYQDNTTYFQNNAFRNNLFYKSGVTKLLYYQKYTDSPLTVAQFNAKNLSSTNLMSGCGKDSISDNLVGDPLFVDITNADYFSRDYHLQPGSPALGTGIDVGLTADYEGYAWADTPNIGVYSSTGIIVYPKYTSSVIYNATPSTLEITFDLSLTNVVPATSAFSVLVNSVSRSVTTVSVSGTKVYLTLASAVVAGDVVTVSYTTPSASALQTPSGVPAVSFSLKDVSNKVGQSEPVPTYVSSVINNNIPSLIYVTVDVSLATVIPSATAFTVMVNSVNRPVLGVNVSGTKVFIALSSAVVMNDVVTVSYTPPANNPLQTPTGVLAAAFSNKAVTNNVTEAVAVPKYVSSVINNSLPAVIEITFDVTLTSIIPSASAFTVMVNSVGRAVKSVTVSGAIVYLLLSSAVAENDIVTVTYVQPSANPLQTSAGSKAESFSNKVVTNNVSAVVPKITGGIYPNPASKYVIVSLNEAALVPYKIRIFSYAGEIVIEKVLEVGNQSINIPLNLSSGIYIVQMLSGNIVVKASPLVINR